MSPEASRTLSFFVWFTVIITTIMIIGSCSDDTPKSYKDATNAEKQKFWEWDAKQKQKEWNNKVNSN